MVGSRCLLGGSQAGFAVDENMFPGLPKIDNYDGPFDLEQPPAHAAHAEAKRVGWYRQRSERHLGKKKRLGLLQEADSSGWSEKGAGFEAFGRSIEPELKIVSELDVVIDEVAVNCVPLTPNAILLQFCKVDF